MAGNTKPFSPPVGMMNSVVVFSLGYVGLTIIASLYVLYVKQSVFVTMMAIYLYGHICLNWLALFQHSSKDTGEIDIYSNEHEERNTSHCAYCDIIKQKKSHHCPLCRCCILKHDHHCFFLGTCIGLHNQRFFVILCLYLGIGSLYLSLQIFLISDWVFVHWYNYLELFMPFGYMFTLYRAESLISAYLVIIYNLSAVSGMFCLFMFGLQVFLLSNNVTWHEYNSQTSSNHKNYFVSVKSCIEQINLLWTNFKSNYNGRYGLKYFIVPVLPYIRSSSTYYKNERRMEV